MEDHDQPSVIKFSFKKTERLKSKKLIKELFEKGSSFFLYPFKTVYLQRSESDAVTSQILIAVSRKAFKRAVDRNTIKRRTREAYRLNKPLLTDCPPLCIGFVFVGKEIMSFHEIERKLKTILMRLNEKCSTN